MKKYEVRGTSVFETATAQIIFDCSDLRKTQRIAKELNNGTGFNGWTPEFILRDKLFGSSRFQS